MSEEEDEYLMETICEAINFDRLIKFLRSEYERGVADGIKQGNAEAAYQRGRDSYRDELLAKMEAPKVPSHAKLDGATEPVTHNQDHKPVDRIRADRPNGARSPGALRPAGIPSTFTMIQIVLDEESVIKQGGATLQELADIIAARWWPGMHKNSIAADISTWTTKGRLSRDANGKLLLTEQGRKVISADLRLKPRETASETTEKPTSALVEPAAPTVTHVQQAAPTGSETRVLPEEPAKVPVPAVRPTLGPRPAPPPPQRPAPSGQYFIFEPGRVVELTQPEFRMASVLKKAMGKGHIDYPFLANHGRGTSFRNGISDKSWLAERVPIMVAKLEAIGVTVEHSPNYGYTMKDLRA